MNTLANVTSHKLGAANGEITCNRTSRQRLDLRCARRYDLHNHLPPVRWFRFDWHPVHYDVPIMHHGDLEVGRKYRCLYKGKTYFATVVDKKSSDVWVQLSDIVNGDGDAGDPVEALGMLGVVVVPADDLLAM